MESRSGGGFRTVWIGAGLASGRGADDGYQGWHEENKSGVQLPGLAGKGIREIQPIGQAETHHPPGDSLKKDRDIYRAAILQIPIQGIENFIHDTGLSPFEQATVTGLVGGVRKRQNYPGGTGFGDP